MNKVYIAVANSVGMKEYGLAVGRKYKVEQSNYGTLVYDIFGNYITEARADAFNDYMEIK